MSIQCTLEQPNVHRRYSKTFIRSPFCVIYLGISAASIFPPFHSNCSFPIHLAGDPLDVKAWNWYHGHVGQGRCRVVDAWWQTG